MPHSRDDQRAVLGGRSRNPVNQRERTGNRRARAAAFQRGEAAPQEEVPQVPEEEIRFREGVPQSLQDQLAGNREDTFLSLETREPSEAFMRQIGGRQTVQDRSLSQQRVEVPESLRRQLAGGRVDEELEGPPPPPKNLREVAEESKALVRAKDKLDVRIDDLLELEELDPTQALAARQIREGLEVDRAEIEVNLLELQNSLGIEDKLFELKAEHAGLSDSLDLGPLEEALGVEGGLGHQTLQAILDIADNEALSQSQQNEAIDLVLTRRNISDELIKAVNDMVDTQTHLQELEDMTDRELLDNAAEFIAPTLTFDVQGINDSDRFLSDMLNFVDSALESFIPTTIPEEHPSWALYKETILSVMEFGVNNDVIQADINQLAEWWDMDAGEISATMKTARMEAIANKKAWDEALEADEARPGSGTLVAAIYQAGELIGWNPDQLEMAAKSRDLHALIDVMSGGVSGVENEGNIRGIGGLTLAMYEERMGEEWTPNRGMQWELQAMLSYIDEYFNGDTLSAIRFFREAEEWGGSGTISGGKNIVSEVGA